MDSSIEKAEPGDLGWVISMHGLIYSKEFGFNNKFELKIASKMIDFYKKEEFFNTLWIKKVNSENAGSIAVSKLSESVAFINFLVVPEKFRRDGIARELMNRAIYHSTYHNYSKIRLETYSCLTNARIFYRETGFKMVECNQRIKSFGKIIDQEYWELEL